MSKPWKTTVRLQQDWRTGQPVEVNLSIDIDWDKVARQLAYGANKSKRGKSALLCGAIKAKVIA